MTEKDSFVMLAQRILDDPKRDLDDLSVLSHQLLRREERLQRIIMICNGIGAADSLISRIARGEA